MKRPSKHRNIKVTTEEGVFDSKKEHRRWCDLKLMQQAGEIRDLKRQVDFPMVVNGQLVCTYRADATYVETSTGEFIVEDVKSPTTRKEPVYRIKAKLAAAIHNIKIREV